LIEVIYNPRSVLRSTVHTLTLMEIIKDHPRLSPLGQPPPPTVQEMVDFADAVVVAHHTGATEVRQSATSVAGYTLVSTSHTFRVIEIVKFNAMLPAVGATFPVVTPGGNRNRGTHVERTRVGETEPMNLQGTYVVFLSGKSKLQLLWSHGGLLEITSGFVKSGSLDVARHNGKPADAFLAELRQAAGN
jgi:hypothetical protein